MTFIGRLKRNSPVWRRWHTEKRTGGVLHGVHFAWEPGDVYRTLPLASDQIDLLKNRDFIVLETVSVDLPSEAPVALPQKPVAVPEKPQNTPNKPVYINNQPPRGRR